MSNIIFVTIFTGHFIHIGHNNDPCVICIHYSYLAFLYNDIFINLAFIRMSEIIKEFITFIIYF